MFNFNRDLYKEYADKFDDLVKTKPPKKGERLTDKYLYITGKLDDRKANYDVIIYGDSAKKVTVGTGKYVVADNLVDLIIPNYDRKKVTYKHGFKKAQDGHWYWVSSEQVK